nr:hypothetical protein [Tanacetum cinerariifolium]
MLDSEDSTVTYTKVSSLFEDLSDIRSPRVNGLSMMLQEPYAYVEAALQAPPSLDYVPGPEHPLSPAYVPEFFPEPTYPEFMPLEDDVLPAEEQPLPVAEDPEEDDEDPEEDLTDYPTDIDDDDKEDEDKDKEEEEEEEEEYLALADSVPPHVHRVTILSPPLSVSSLPLLASVTYTLGYRVVMIRLRVEASFTSHPLPSSTPPSGTSPLLPIPLPISLPPLLLPYTSHRA